MKTEDQLRTEKLHRRQRRKLMLSRGPKFMKEKFQSRIFLVPSCITVVGIFCGFLAIISGIRGHYEYASKCIFLAIVIDGIDGRVARRLNATSAFGKEFDSLSDLITFGVAPAVLYYTWAFFPLADEIGVLAGFFYIVCAAARLARFNVDETTEPKAHFVGLPSPGAAAATASVVFAAPSFEHSDLRVGFLLVYLVFVGAMMVSTIPFFSVKKLKFTPEQKKYYLLALALLVPLTWKYSGIMLVIGSVAYAFSGVVQYLARGRRKKAAEKGVEPSLTVT